MFFVFVKDEVGVWAMLWVMSPTMGVQSASLMDFWERVQSYVKSEKRTALRTQPWGTSALRVIEEEEWWPILIVNQFYWIDRIEYRAIIHKWHTDVAVGIFQMGESCMQWDEDGIVHGSVA